MFYNLLAEMIRHGITKHDIATCLGVSDKTIRNYLNGTSKISWSDTLKIRRTYFPNLDIEYLFQTDEKN